MNLKVWHVYLVGGMQPVNGVVSVAGQLVAAQVAAGVDADFQVITTEPERQTVPEGARAVLRGFANVRVADRWWRGELQAGRAPDLVHFHEVLRPPHRLLAHRLAPFGIPYVVSTHGGLMPQNLARFRWKKAPYGLLIERSFLRGAEALVGGNPAEAKANAAYIGGGSTRSIVIENPIDPSGFAPPSWQQSRQPQPPAGAERRRRIVTLCRYDVRQKGLDTLAAIAVDLDGVDVVVHGEQCRNEPERTQRLREWAPPNFVLAPPVFGPDKRAALVGADLFIQPSRWEGLSASLIEAMAAGVPCAVSEAIAATLPFAQQDLGLVLSPNPREAAGQLRVALDDADRLRRWSTNARRYATEHFSNDAVWAKAESCYRTALATSSSGAGARRHQGSHS